MIGEYNGILWVPNAIEPEIWHHIKGWPYFSGFRSAILGTYVFKALDFTVQSHKVPGVEILYQVGSHKHSIATVVAKAGQAGMTDLCPRCRIPGTFFKTALICPQCKKFLGGF